MLVCQRQTDRGRQRSWHPDAVHSRRRAQEHDHRPTCFVASSARRHRCQMARERRLSRHVCTAVYSPCQSIRSTGRHAYFCHHAHENLNRIHSILRGSSSCYGDLGGARTSSLHCSHQGLGTLQAPHLYRQQRQLSARHPRLARHFIRMGCVGSGRRFETFITFLFS